MDVALKPGDIYRRHGLSRDTYLVLAAGRVELFSSQSTLVHRQWVTAVSAGGIDEDWEVFEHVWVLNPSWELA